MVHVAVEIQQARWSGRIEETQALISGSGVDTRRHEITVVVDESVELWPLWICNDMTHLRWHIWKRTRDLAVSAAWCDEAVALGSVDLGLEKESTTEVAGFAERGCVLLHDTSGCVSTTYRMCLV